MNVRTVAGLGEIHPGESLGTLLAQKADIAEDDVVCVASTIVSKAENRFVDLESITAGERARSIADRLATITDEPKDPRFAQVVLEEASELLTTAPFLLTRTHFGHVTVNAGIDRSNVPNHDLLLLPEDPMASASQLADALDAPVIITDTCGRPFRHGQRGVAIGWAGLPASRDWRGETDRNGHELEVTVESVVDELAATANLLSGEGDGGTPVVVIESFEFGEHGGSNELFRDPESDLVGQALNQWEYQP
ncbi:coenzyme F420-0:L-glutamate ligase [Halocatena halophila]|uniref:coenzyme F420-0:L-glutamate ligase n=1 Tax=Halocatena halophila TaxID=2814576 RepID=UPI002ED4CA26